MEYKTTNEPIPLINRTNNKLSPSKKKSNWIDREGIQLYEWFTGENPLPTNCMKYVKISNGTSNTKIPVCILCFILLIIGIKKAITSGAKTA